jgi:prepilin-type processing-associated H-X9-DG protein
MFAIGDSVLHYMNESYNTPLYIRGNVAFTPGMAADFIWVPNFKPTGSPDTDYGRGRNLVLKGAKLRHNNRWNTLFCDGHVESLKQAGLFEVRRADVAKRWNKDNLPHHELVPGR